MSMDEQDVVIGLLRGFSKGDMVITWHKDLHGNDVIGSGKLLVRLDIFIDTWQVLVPDPEDYMSIQWFHESCLEHFYQP